MQLLKLTVLSSLLFAFAVSFISCEKDSERAKVLVYTKSDITMTGAQSVPASNSGALGSLNVTYNKTSKILSYTFNWTGLSAPPSKIYIYGPAPTGYGSTTIKQTVLSAANPALYPASGSFTGSVYVDDVLIIEQELLNYLYYVSIITPLYPQGEIRGQIRFQ
ncbi:MAG: CHRD domain-containing protein [Bacteroidota bacterium]|nr:CHRD domain-containing protein [Bacteroidota bacterium]